MSSLESVLVAEENRPAWEVGEGQPAREGQRCPHGEGRLHAGSTSECCPLFLELS